NPYLAFAAYLAAGLDGIQRRLDPGEPNLGNLYEMSLEEMAKRKVRVLPQSLDEAIDELQRDPVIQAGIGVIAPEVIKLKRMERLSPAGFGLGSGAVSNDVLTKGMRRCCDTSS